NVVWSAPTTATAMMQVTVTSLQSTQPIPNLTVSACGMADVDCASPIQMATTDANGGALLTVPLGPTGFEGFFELQGPGVPPSLVFAYPPITADGPLAIPLLDDATFDLFTGFVGVVPDATRGHLALIAFDCAPAEAQGIEVTASSADGMSDTVYLENGLPS